MTMESTVYRYDRTPFWAAKLAELPGVGFLLLRKAFSLLFALPLYVVFTGHRRCREKLYRRLAFPVF